MSKLQDAKKITQEILEMTEGGILLPIIERAYKDYWFEQDHRFEEALFDPRYTSGTDALEKILRTPALIAAAKALPHATTEGIVRTLLSEDVIIKVQDGNTEYQKFLEEVAANHSLGETLRRASRSTARFAGVCLSQDRLVIGRLPDEPENYEGVLTVCTDARLPEIAQLYRSAASPRLVTKVAIDVFMIAHRGPQKAKDALTLFTEDDTVEYVRRIADKNSSDHKNGILNVTGLGNMLRAADLATAQRLRDIAAGYDANRAGRICNGLYFMITDQEGNLKPNAEKYLELFSRPETKIEYADGVSMTDIAERHGLTVD
jgi:hypothetical protein